MKFAELFEFGVAQNSATGVDIEKCQTCFISHHEPTIGVDTAEIWPSEAWRRYIHTAIPLVISDSLVLFTRTVM